MPPISNIMHYYACFLASFIMSFNFNNWCLKIKISAEISSIFISIISCIAPSARQIETSRAVSTIMVQTRALSVHHYQLGLIISQSLIMTCVGLRKAFCQLFNSKYNSWYRKTYHYQMVLQYWQIEIPEIGCYEQIVGKMYVWTSELDWVLWKKNHRELRKALKSWCGAKHSAWVGACNRLTLVNHIIS